MSLAIVLVCLALYIGLAVLIGRFCGINSAWERVVEDAMRQHPTASGLRAEESEARKLDGAEQILRDSTTQANEKDAATQLA